MVRWILLSGGKIMHGLLALPITKNVGKPSDKAAAATDSFHMKHIKRARLSLSVGDHISSSQVSTSSHHAQVTGDKLNKVDSFVCLQISLNGISHIDEGSG